MNIYLQSFREGFIGSFVIAREIVSALLDLLGGVVLFVVLLVLMAIFSHAAHARLPQMCESESMMLVQVGDGKPREILGSVLYFDTISDPNALILRTSVDSPAPFHLQTFRIRYEYIIQEVWDPFFSCSLYLKYDADGISSESFEGDDHG
jgi:hypothetical protein